MRKIASLAALTLCVVAGGASAASADVSIGPLAPGTPTTAPDPGTLGFANTWCGAPWEWSGQQSGTGCAAQHGGGAAGQ